MKQGEIRIEDLEAALLRMEGRDRLLLGRGSREIAFLREWLLGERPLAETGVSGEGGKDVRSLRKIIEDCSRCGKVREKKYGKGTGENRIMVLLHAPRLIGEGDKKTLRGESAELLRRMLSAMGAELDQCYVTNLIKCESDDALSRPGQMYKNCEAVLGEEIDVMRPALVLVMGEIIPLKKLIGNRPEIAWFNIDHPYTLIKNPDLKRPAWNTLKLAMQKLRELKLL